MTQQTFNPLTRRPARRSGLAQIRTWLVWAALVIVLVGGCAGLQSAPRPGLSRSARTGDQFERIDSPQGDRSLLITVNTSRDDPTKYLTLVFEVRDQATQAMLHRQQTSASSRMAWSMRWLDNRSVQLRRGRHLLAGAGRWTMDGSELPLIVSSREHPQCCGPEVVGRHNRHTMSASHDI